LCYYFNGYFLCFTDMHHCSTDVVRRNVSDILVVGSFMMFFCNF